ncbi:NB-ARC domains-containing protein [Artemisia annua]|uniref:NB-ARC domains-containing protein n=1 Tax=Artemisia annua TaxID=35608 RepID=A0A2U1M802_ARTAN|nr:NB-ARC domains-containing protein [Artemisia annua]
MAEAIISSMVGKVVDILFGKVKREIKYMWKCPENVAKLKDELQNLKDMRGRVQQKIDRAKDKGDNLITGVEEWVEKAGTEIEKAEEFLKEEANAKKTCFKIGLCGNWHTLYHYGKTATKMSPYLLQHQEGGKGYETCVSVDTPAPGPLEVYQNKNLDDIATQNSALGDIITAIEDESKQIIGIYGIGGVGKTTLAMEVGARVKHLFAAVAFTTVSQTVSVEKIQKDIENATKRIMKGEKILIILDDVWEMVDLEKLCIPCGINHMNCKILLTSRSEYVCEKMNAHKIHVNALPKKEAWIHFKRVVGEEVERDADLKRVAMAVAEECGGLPLLLKAIGNALKTKSIEDWDKALTRLQEHAPSRIDPAVRKSFTHLKLSYDYLEDEEAKSCFLFCSMFPEDEEILLGDLVLYAVGLAKFHGLKSLEDARQRVENAVEILTSSGLLLKRDYKEYTKMHDVVRDVALLIASEGDGKNKFLVEAGKGLAEWLPRKNELESYTGISLMTNNISMKEVIVLDMACCGSPPLPPSLKLLTKLRVVNLKGNKSVLDISILSEMKDLEILILDKTGIREIPQEISQLVNLRLLRAMDCENLYHVAPGVISKLWRLEQLLIGFMSLLEGIYERIVEIMNLSNLTYLALHVPRFDVVPEGFNPRKLKGFSIQIGGYLEHYSLAGFKYRRLVIVVDYVEIPFLKWLKQLTEASHSIDLDSIENLNNILPQLYHEGFNELEHIKLDSCPIVSCLVDTANWDQSHTFHSSKHLGEGQIKEKFLGKLKHLSLEDLDSLEVLWKCPDEYISLCNLVTLGISSCDKLVKVLPMSVAQGLVNLQKLHINFCSSLEEVIWDGDEETSESETEHSEYIVFRSLAMIDLYGLERLERFYSGHSTIKYPSLVDAEIYVCPSMKMWGPGIHETPKLKFVNYVQLDGPDATINYAVNKIYEELRRWADEEEGTSPADDLSKQIRQLGLLNRLNLMKKRALRRVHLAKAQENSLTARI